jgi:hypothetical protein
MDLANGEWFDIVRDVRRRISSDVLKPRLRYSSDMSFISTTASPVETPVDASERGRFLSILSFALGAASCSTSVECSLENKAEAMTERNAALGKACELVNKACRGNAVALSEIRSLLSVSLENQCKVVYCYIALDHSSKRVSIGRKDAEFASPSSVSLPIYDDLMSALNDWNDIIENNKTQLHQTSSASEISGWGKSEKVKWWNDRDQLDRRVKTFLEDIQFKLGPWRCLLSPTVPESARSVEGECYSQLVDLFRTYSSVKEPKKKTQKKTSATSPRDPVDDTASVIGGVLSWLSLLMSPYNNLETCERVVGFSDVLLCALSHFVEVGVSAEEMESDVLRVAVAIVNSHCGESNNVQQQERSIKRDEDDAIGRKQCDMSAQSSGAYDSDSVSDRVEEMKSRVATLKVADLKKELKDLGAETTGKKSELLKRLIKCLSESMEVSMSADSCTLMDEAPECDQVFSESSPPPPAIRQTHHIALILDEMLQAMPWESIPMLRASSCSRLPSLSVLVNLLHNASSSSSEAFIDNSDEKEKKNSAKRTKKKVGEDGTNQETRSEGNLISVARCWYAVDPDANLERTRSTIMTFIEPYATKWQWRGFAGEKPPDDAIR